MFNLANMYFSGEGTTKDIQTAYKLFLQSKIRGIKESEYYINLISSDLSFEELNYLNEENKQLIEKKMGTSFLILMLHYINHQQVYH